MTKRPQKKSINRTDFAAQKTSKKSWNNCIDAFDKFLPTEDELNDICIRIVYEIHNRASSHDISSPEDVGRFMAKIIHNRLKN
jgi:hypothetical protein